MSEPVTKQRPSIDFDEFERAVRNAAQPSRPQLRGQEDDPLAELARLVGTHHDPYGEVFAQNEAQQPEPRRSSLDFAAIEAGLRGTIPAHEAHQPHDQFAQDDQAYYDQHDQAAQPHDDAGWYDHAQDAPPAAEPTRSRRPVYAMAAVILAGVVGIGVAFAYKGSNSGPREIAMIKAAPGPTKIQPPADGSSDQPSRDASILDKAQQPAPTKLVSREEQPVDLAQTVQNAPRDVGLTPLYNFGAASNAAGVPVPAPPGQAQSDQKPMGIAGDIEPIRVKTRSYRPDGTPIPNDQPPTAAMAAAAPASKADKAAVAKASTPKSVTPKSTTRVASTPKPLVTADNGDAAPTDLNAAAAAPAPHKVKPVKAAATKPVQVANAPDAADDAAQTASVPAGGGGFAVQLAAPGSEAEAKAASSKLSAKFAGALSGHHLSFHKAESNGKSVYRVRVGSLSREEANGICEKLKSSGGSCFVAKN